MKSLEKILNNRIRELLTAKNYSQRWLADKTDIQSSYLNEMLNGKPTRRWNIEHIEKVADALDVPVWQLFAAPEDLIPAPTLELIRLYANLSKDDKRIVDAILKTPGNGDQNRQPKVKVT